MSIVFLAIICVEVLHLGSSARTLQQFHDHRKSNASRRELGSFSGCGTGNPIDDCWRCDPNWSENRQKYADCAMGFGKKAVGGKNGEIYVVTRTDDHPVNPRPGTLRYAVTRDEPLQDRELGEFSCGGNGNPIDDCWRCKDDWHKNRQSYADCAVGFGKNAVGGKDGKIYVVTSTNDNPTEPQPGTLRYAVIQDEPLWIVFKEDMRLRFKQELIMASYKTIDGRGSKVEIVGPACFTVQYVYNIIITNLNIRNCRPTGGNAMVRSSTTHVGYRTMADGDAISIFGSSHVWVDHCTLSSCADGLVDAVAGSTNITVSNCYFSHHNEVMLLGHLDTYTDDKNMRVTVAFNHFGEGLIQRMPRCRHGVFHVVNNVYKDWEMYAIGGSAKPLILSQGNKFIANPNNPRTLEVTKHLNCKNEAECESWNWISENDIMVNGAYFKTSGSSSINDYATAESMSVAQGSDIYTLTANAGVLD